MIKGVFVEVAEGVGGEFVAVEEAGRDEDGEHALAERVGIASALISNGGEDVEVFVDDFIFDRAAEGVEEEVGEDFACGVEF